jgi:tripartite-type tricarboxylate transporter receptor subunit TctC
MAIWISAALACHALVASAQEFPTRPVTIVDTFAAGGNTDFQARLMAPELARLLGQPVIVENRPGASGIVALEYITTSLPADGHTLLISAPGLFILPLTAKNLKADPLRDLTPISVVSESPLLLASSPQAPWNGFSDFVSAVKASPGKFNYGGSGFGIGMLLVEAVKQRYGLDIVSIPYKGTAQINAGLLANEVQLAVTVEAAAPAFIEKNAKIIAVTGGSRLASLPDVPTFAQLGFSDMLSGTILTLSARAGAPAPALRRLNAAIATAMQNQAIRDSLMKARMLPTASASLEAADKRVRDEVVVLTRIIKAAGIQPQ